MDRQGEERERKSEEEVESLIDKKKRGRESEEQVERGRGGGVEGKKKKDRKMEVG